MNFVTAKELKDLQDKGEKVLAQITASWCGPCKALTPKLSNMSNQYEDIKFVKVDVDNGENVDLIMELGVMSVPTVVVYNGQKLVDLSKGVQPDTYYKEVLNRL